MSAGTPRYTFRLPEELMDAVRERTAQRNMVARGKAWEVSDFVRIAICEKLNKMERSARGRQERRRRMLLEETGESAGSEPIRVDLDEGDGE